MGFGALIGVHLLPLVTWVRLIVWLAAGLAVYFAWGRKHSALRGRSPDKV